MFRRQAYAGRPAILKTKSIRCPTPVAKNALSSAPATLVFSLIYAGIDWADVPIMMSNLHTTTFSSCCCRS